MNWYNKFIIIKILCLLITLFYIEVDAGLSEDLAQLATTVDVAELQNVIKQSSSSSETNPISIHDGIVSIHGKTNITQSLTVQNHSYFNNNVYIKNNDKTLFLGALNGIPTITSGEDGNGNDDLLIKASHGKKIYFGESPDDAYIESGTGNAYFKGNIVTKGKSTFFGGVKFHNYIYIDSNGSHLRLGDVNGMPGIYASEGEDRDLFIGTAVSKKIYFGSSLEEAWIEAGTGNAHFNGNVNIGGNVNIEKNLNIKNNIRISTGKEGVLSIGKLKDNKVGMMLEGGSNDFTIATSSGSKIILGSSKSNMVIDTATASTSVSGTLSVGGMLNVANGASIGTLISVKTSSSTAASNASALSNLVIGSRWNTPSIFIDPLSNPSDIVISSSLNHKIYIGYGTNDAWIEAGTGNAFFNGAVTINKNLTVQGVSKLQSVVINSSHSTNTLSIEPNDEEKTMTIAASSSLFISSPRGSRIHFGSKLNEIYFDSGSGSAFFNGMLTVNEKLTVLGGMTVDGNIVLNSTSSSSESSSLIIGNINGIVGIMPNPKENGSDLFIGAGRENKIYFGSSTSTSSVDMITGNSYFSGDLSIDGHLISNNTAMFNSNLHILNSETNEKDIVIGKLNKNQVGVHSLHNDLVFTTSENRSIYFATSSTSSSNRVAMSINSSSGDVNMSGHLTVDGTLTVRQPVEFQTLHFLDTNNKSTNSSVGTMWNNKFGIFSSSDLVIGASQKIYFGSNVDSASYFDTQLGDLFLHGSLISNNLIVKKKASFFDNIYINSNKHKMIIGTVDNIPSIVGINGLVITTSHDSTNSKIYFGSPSNPKVTYIDKEGMVIGGQLQVQGSVRSKILQTNGCSIYSNKHISEMNTDTDASLSLSVADGMSQIIAKQSSLFFDLEVGHRINFGTHRTPSAMVIESGSGNMWVKGSLKLKGDLYVNVSDDEISASAAASSNEKSQVLDKTDSNDLMDDPLSVSSSANGTVMNVGKTLQKLREMNAYLLKELKQTKELLANIMRKQHKL